MDTISLWEAISTRIIDYPELTNDIEVDIAIIGRGITGITEASHLNSNENKLRSNRKC